MYLYYYGKSYLISTLGTLRKINKCITITQKNCNKVHVTYKGTDYQKYTVVNKGISIWNCLDDTIKNLY